MKHTTAAMIGAGLIGTGWAVVFARAGSQVRIFDTDEVRARQSREQAAGILRELAELGLAQDPDVAAARIGVATSVADAIRGADWIQESVAEDAAIKSRVIDAIQDLSPAAIIASSASTIPPDELFANSVFRERCIIAHPFNPPYMMPLVELVKSTWTSQHTAERAKATLASVGMSAVVLHKPIYGFAINRLQAAVVNEAMYLVQQGVLDPADVDRCVTEGLGLRWGFIGPFATMDLNAPGGIAEYMHKFGDAYAALGRELAHATPWSEQTMQRVETARRQLLPLAGLPAGRMTRDAMIAALLRLRRAEFPSGVDSNQEVT